MLSTYSVGTGKALTYGHTLSTGKREYKHNIQAKYAICTTDVVLSISDPFIIIIKKNPENNLQPISNT